MEGAPLLTINPFLKCKQSQRPHSTDEPNTWQLLPNCHPTPTHSYRFLLGIWWYSYRLCWNNLHFRRQPDHDGNCGDREFVAFQLQIERHMDSLRDCCWNMFCPNMIQMHMMTMIRHDDVPYHPRKQVR